VVIASEVQVYLIYVSGGVFGEARERVAPHFCGALPIIETHGAGEITGRVASLNGSDGLVVLARSETGIETFSAKY